MNTSQILRTLMPAVAVAAGVLAAPSARAEMVYGLTSTGGLFSFNSASPSATSAVTTITGITAGQTVYAIDFRPATGELYALSYASGTGAAQLYTLNLGTAVATPIGSGLALPTGNTNGRFTFDFNPTVDRIRLIFGPSQQNYRLNPVTGAIAATDTNVVFGSGDPNFGNTPFIASGAYTNSFAGATTTTLYGYDYNSDSIVTIGGPNGNPSPNLGQAFTVGASGITTGTAAIGFDISPAGNAFLSADTTGTSNLYSVNLGTGAVTLLGGLNGLTVRSIAVVPEPGTFALVGLAGSALLFARLRRRQS